MRADDDDVDGAVRPPADTPDRDADLALESASAESDSSASEEEAQGASEEHQSRMDRQRQTEVDEYAVEEELLLGTVDEEALVDDPFDPGYGDDGEYEGGDDDGWNPVPPDEQGSDGNGGLPFGSAFRVDPVEEQEEDEDARLEQGTEDAPDQASSADGEADHDPVARGRVGASRRAGAPHHRPAHARAVREPPKARERPQCPRPRKPSHRRRRRPRVDGSTGERRRRSIPRGRVEHRRSLHLTGHGPGITDPQRPGERLDLEPVHMVGAGRSTYQPNATLKRVVRRPPGRPDDRQHTAARAKPEPRPHARTPRVEP